MNRAKIQLLFLAASYTPCKNRFRFGEFANGVFWNIRSMNSVLTEKANYERHYRKTQQG